MTTDVKIDDGHLQHYVLRNFSICRTVDGVIHVAYVKPVGGTNTRVFYARSLDKGLTWTNITQLDPYSGGRFAMFVPSIHALISSEIDVIWSGLHAGSPATYQERHNRFNGVAWAGPAAITNAVNPFHQYDQNSDHCLMFDAAGTLHIVYYGYDDTGAVNGTAIKYRSWTLGGGWSAATIIRDYGQLLGVGDAYTPGLWIDSAGGLHVTWYETDDIPGFGGSNLYYTYKPPGGPWTPIRGTPITNDGLNYAPAIALDNNGEKHVVWTYLTGGITVVYYMRTIGGVWQAPVNLTPGETNEQDSPFISFDKMGRIYVVWDGCHAGSPFFYQLRMRVFDGVSWSPIQELTNDAWNHLCPSPLAAYHPNQVNIPDSGCAFTYFRTFVWPGWWMDADGDVRFFATDDFILSGGYRSVGPPPGLV